MTSDDFKDFEKQWRDKGRNVQIVNFAPDVVVVDLNGLFSANELRALADFLDSVEDE